MKYCIAEHRLASDGGRTAWSKAREDAERISAGAGYQALPIRPAAGDRVNAGLWKKLRAHWTMGRIWREALGILKPGDTLLIQLPVIHNSLLLPGLLRRAKRRGVRIIGLVHDLETLRMSLDRSLDLRSRVRMHLEETGTLRVCRRLIVHNERMGRLMAERGFAREKLVPLGIFDYLVEPEAEKAVLRRTPSPRRDRLLAAGNLSPEKAGYLYDLPEGLPMELYGVGFDAGAAGSGLRHHGAFDPGALPAVLDGGFGLVWDGPGADTCRGVYGEYLRYNNPHKTSLYLASGLPVAIWDGAALAELVESAGAGFCASSVAEAADRAARMEPEEYAACFRNAAALGARLRRGEFLRAALEKAEGAL